MAELIKYHSYSESLKLRVVKELESGVARQCDVSKKYGIPTSTIRCWLLKYSSRYQNRIKVRRHYEGHVYMDKDTKLEQERLERENEDLKLKLEVYEHMFDIGKEDYNFDLKKKVSTKQLEELKKKAKK